ncbi:MAG: CDP-alcohol phosphatidyltransferase family protein [Phycisphaeraceae bacterium]|nr:CDP-alcohol phosphatidyltransferase family protein [Phycisphaeraceae bacterium]
MTSVPRPAILTLPAPTALQRALPNWLTASRVVLAGVFFAVLTLWRFEDSAAARSQVDWMLLGAAALFGIAVATDALDGYLARRWKVESMFGRIMDPFADKILVLGALVFLAGPDFWWRFPDGHPARVSGHGIQISGVYPWMAVLMVGRELLVTSIRAVLEGQGVKFSSDWWGKWKMILQSAAIPAILIIIAAAPVRPDAAGAFWKGDPGRVVVDLIVWTTLAVTVLSGVPYVARCLHVLAQRRERSSHDAG